MCAVLGRSRRPPVWPFSSDCSFRGAQFRYSVFSKALSRRTVVSKASFTNCNFTDLDIDGLLDFPTGDWGHSSKNVGGVQVPARSTRGIYWDGVS